MKKEAPAKQDLVRVEAKPIGRTAFDHHAEAVEQAFFRGRSPHTIRSDQKSLAIFAQFLGVSSFKEMVRVFLAGGQGPANMKALEFKNWLVDQGKAPSTVNRRLGALNSLVRSFRFAGAIPWDLEVQYVPVETYRDTSGPGTEHFATAMETLDDQNSPMAVRDRTILILLHDGALRRGELCSIDLEHYDPSGPCVWVKAKKRTARVRIDLSKEMKAAIDEWIKVRGDKPGALLKNFDPAAKSDRLSERSIARITHKRGVGRPHGIRHLALSEYCEATNGNIVEVMKLGRQRDPKTTMIYIDNLKKRDAKASEILAGFRKKSREKNQ